MLLEIECEQLKQEIDMIEINLLPPFILFCDAIVGRIIPPRGAGVSGSESL